MYTHASTACSRDRGGEDDSRFRLEAWPGSVPGVPRAGRRSGRRPDRDALAAVPKPPCSTRVGRFRRFGPAGLFRHKTFALVDDLIEPEELASSAWAGPRPACARSPASSWAGGRRNRRRRIAGLLLEADAVARAAIQIARPLGEDPATHPIVDACLADGSRVAVCADHRDHAPPLRRPGVRDRRADPRADRCRRRSSRTRRPRSGTDATC